MKLTMDDEDLAPGPTEPAAPAPAPDLSVLLIGLLKGVLYREADERQWSSLLQLQARVREYVAVLNLELVLDEAEGYAFLRGRPEPADDDPACKPQHDGKHDAATLGRAEPAIERPRGRCKF